MDTVLMESAIQHGLWATLFVGLFLWVMKENSKREDGYKAIIHELTEKFGKLDESVKKLTEKLEGRI